MTNIQKHCFYLSCSFFSPLITLSVLHSVEKRLFFPPLLFLLFPSVDSAIYLFLLLLFFFSPSRVLSFVFPLLFSNNSYQKASFAHYPATELGFFFFLICPLVSLSLRTQQHSKKKKKCRTLKKVKKKKKLPPRIAK